MLLHVEDASGTKQILKMVTRGVFVQQKWKIEGFAMLLEEITTL